MDTYKDKCHVPERFVAPRGRRPEIGHDHAGCRLGCEARVKAPVNGCCGKVANMVDPAPLPESKGYAQEHQCADAHTAVVMDHMQEKVPSRGREKWVVGPRDRAGSRPLDNDHGDNDPMDCDLKTGILGHYRRRRGNIFT